MMRYAFVFIALMLNTLAADAQVTGVSCCDWMMLKRQKLGAFQLSKDINADGLEMDMGPLGRRVLFENRFRTHPNETATFRHTADSLGIRVSSVAMSGFFAQTLLDRRFNEYTREDGTKDCYPHTKAESLQNYRDLFDDCFSTMEKFGAKVAFLPLGGSGKEWQTGDGAAYDTLVVRLRMIGEMARQRGVVVGIRTAMPADFSIRMLRDINSPGIKIYYNLQDACDNHWDACQELRKLGPDRLCQIHCSNTDSVTLRHDPEVDLPKLVRTLKEIGYQGWLTVERSRNAKAVKNVRGNYGDNVAYIKEVLAEVYGKK